jgi:hypothetical protein
MHILDEYLEYLNDPTKKNINEGGFDFKGNISAGWNQGWWWGLFYIPATILAWKAASTLFSKATRKCGGMRSSTPGFKVCVSRERIKALKQKVALCDKLLSGCHGAKDPELCKEKWGIQKEKALNRIEIEQGKISTILGGVTEQQEHLQEFIGTVGGLAVMIGTGMIVDKLLFFMQRTAQGMFRKAVRQCGTYEDSPKRNLCMAKAKLAIEDSKARKLMDIVIKCNQEKDPIKCKEKLQKHIEKANREIQIAKDNIASYKNEIIIANREKQFKELLKMKKKAGIK